MLILDKIFLCFPILFVGLLSEVIGHFFKSLSVFLFFLLFSNCKFFVSHFPELGEFFLFLLDLSFLFLNLLQLCSSALLNSGGHLDLTSLFLFKFPSRLILSLCHLLVKHFLLLVSNFHQFFNLSIDKSLFQSLFSFETFFFFSFL